MFPFLVLAVPAILETLGTAAATAVVITVATKAASEAYDAIMKDED